jgi:hypothetical protein
MDLSYTQNLEDYHLSLAFAGQVTGPIFAKKLRWR